MRVQVDGELDIARVGEVRVRLREASASGTDITIDLSSLEFIDCAGVHCLVEAAVDAARGGGRVRIEGDMRPQVRRVFTLLRDVVDSPAAPVSLAA